ncbi:hypothetical protein LJC19_03910 [Oxalobacter sp. OttesenSCG-928-P03]|nr:hypothetical protein [Oxalobacter sp. OttesenSCG-928-P03]
MRKGLLFIIAALFLNTACADPVPPRLMRNLKGHHVMRVTLKKGVLRLVTTHGVVSHDIYENVIREGTCSVLLGDPEKGWGKSRIDRIEVMNRDERQGYAFVDARKACLELGKITDDAGKKTYFSGQTWICTMEICDDPGPVEPKKTEKTGK